MSEEATKDLSDSRSFEERVFARFDAMEARFEARFDAIERRLSTVEEQISKQALDTKPIWERALAEILEVKQKVDEVKAELKAEISELRADVSEVKADVKDIKRKMTVLTQDMMQLRADQLGLERRMDASPSSILPLTMRLIKDDSCRHSDIEALNRSLHWNSNSLVC